MADKKKYYKLDEISFIGLQTQTPATSAKYHVNKTSAFFKKLKEEKSAYKKEQKKV